MADFRTYAEVAKVDEGLGLVFGWSIICKKDGEPYFDVQDDHIPEAAMLEAATDFMQKSRIADEMHRPGSDHGTIVFCFPMTEDVAKAMGVVTKQTGLMIAMKPSPAVLAKFKDGTYKAFSIGGERITDKAAD